MQLEGNKRGLSILFWAVIIIVILSWAGVIAYYYNLGKIESGNAGVIKPGNQNTYNQNLNNSITNKTENIPDNSGSQNNPGTPNIPPTINDSVIDIGGNGALPPEIIDQINRCSPESKYIDACTMDYNPVCGFVQVECIRAPCYPMPQTFSNACMACKEQRVEYYINGECSNNIVF